MGPRAPPAPCPPRHPAGAWGPGPAWSTATSCASWRGPWVARAACPSCPAHPAWVPGSGHCGNGGPAPAAWRCCACSPWSCWAWCSSSHRSCCWGCFSCCWTAPATDHPAPLAWRLRLAGSCRLGAMGPAPRSSFPEAC
uniref:Uncharacterized protein n=1 Tax=Molossus molossus TaxID=27622 RepID=A0A7J8EC46_MOLMO|nr:hypothetical protein HJG59_001640 [Molossus molossus]